MHSRHIIGPAIALALIAPAAIAQASPKQLPPVYAAGPYIKERGGRPVYPPGSREAGEEGKVEVWLNVSANGKITRTGIVTSSGYERLDNATLDWAKTLKIEPTHYVDTVKHENYPVDDRDLRVSYDWRLDGDGRVTFGHKLP